MTRRDAPFPWTLAACALASLELANAAPGEAVVGPFGRAAALFALSVAGSFWFRRMIHQPFDRGERPWLTACLFLAPLLLEIGRLLAFDANAPMERQAFAAMRGLVCALCVAGSLPSAATATAGLSLFAVLYGYATVESRWIDGTAAAYAAAGCEWLVRCHRLRTVAGNRAGKEKVVRPAAIFAFAAAAIAATLLLTSERGTVDAALAEWLSSSGGTSEHHPEARGGVNDGDDLVDGREHPQSESPIGQQFIESNEPSLFDVMNELYGKPLPPRDRQRAVSLDASRMVHSEAAPSSNFKAQREFSTRRETPAKSRRPRDRDADALLYVKGPSPLHLPLETFETFDGRTWKGEASGGSDVIDRTHRGGWMRIAMSDAPFLSGEASLAVTIGRLQTSVLPLPSFTTRFRIADIERADFFRGVAGSLLALADGRLPTGTRIEAAFRTIESPSASSEQFPDRCYYSRVENVRPLAAGEPSAEVRRLALRWGAGESRGWSQIEKIVERLRSEYRLDSSRQPPPDHPDAAHWFLLESKAGPDYLFATAAVVMLRSLDYPARLVGGFYVRPEKRDQRTGQTPVHAQDAHFWIEVQSPSGGWRPLEPTPGYSMTPPARDWSASIRRAAEWVGRWTAERWPWLTAVALAIAACGFFRVELLDAVATIDWQWRRPNQGRAAVLGAARLIDRRARWAGWARPTSRTFRSWFGQAARRAPSEVAAPLARLGELVDWAAYARRDDRLSDFDALACCLEAVDTWTLSRFRQSRRNLERNAHCESESPC